MQLGHSMSVHVLGEMVGNRFGKAGLKQDLGGNWNLKERQMDYIQMEKLLKF